MDKQRLIQTLLPRDDDETPMNWQRAFILAELVAHRYGSQCDDETAKHTANEIADMICNVAAIWKRAEGV